MKVRLLLAIPICLLVESVAHAQTVPCPTQRAITYIVKGVNDTPACLQYAVSQPNAEVLLAPDVDIDFTNIVNPPASTGSEAPLLTLAHCVILASYQQQFIIQARAVAHNPAALPANNPCSNGSGGSLGPGPGNNRIQPVPGSGRTPQSLGPVLHYGTNSNRSPMASFISVPCNSSQNADGSQILGFRVIGPNFNDHQTSEIGIDIEGCHDIEVANMEVAAWGGSAVRVDDAVDFPKGNIPTSEPSPVLIRVHDNYIHHNQHSTSGGHALGYGVVVSGGAFAEIYRNLFDFNRHSIAASGNAGGYHAYLNLLLKGGGYNGNPLERNIHVMDVHGTESCPNIPNWQGTIEGAAIGGGLGWLAGAGIGAAIGSTGGPIGAIIGGVVGAILGAFGGNAVATLTHSLFNCGNAGFNFVMEQNAFQYDKTTDLKIRGEPTGHATISDNIFARSSKSDAIQLETNTNVTVTDSNFYNDDTFGQYGVCDIDGDGIDDLVLMTGVSWWYSSSGVYPWSFLKYDSAVLKNVRLGDFNGDGKCDVLEDAGGGNWMISSGATADWASFGNYLAPLNQVAFGRFDPASPNLSRAILPPTHAFWRGDNGFWFVTPLPHPGGWTLTQSSSFPFADLRFGDFTGNGVTSVFANEAGRWATSYAAREPWKKLNPTLDDTVYKSNIFIAKMDPIINIDDVLRFDVSITPQYPLVTETGTWKISTNGTSPWTTWKAYSFGFDDRHPEDFVGLGAAFVGQFRVPPGEAALTIDPNRYGHFYGPTQSKGGVEWESLFPY
jgi:hypothetical protein